VGQSAAYHVRSTSHEKESRLENKSQEEKRHRADDAANFTRSLSSGMLWAKLMQIE
jgi:hypothetical protein